VASSRSSAARLAWTASRRWRTSPSNSAIARCRVALLVVLAHGRVHLIDLLAELGIAQRAHRPAGLVALARRAIEALDRGGAPRLGRGEQEVALGARRADQADPQLHREPRPRGVDIDQLVEPRGARAELAYPEHGGDRDRHEQRATDTDDLRADRELHESRFLTNRQDTRLSCAP
jgi:hypothetical protein